MDKTTGTRISAATGPLRFLKSLRIPEIKLPGARVRSVMTCLGWGVLGLLMPGAVLSRGIAPFSAALVTAAGGGLPRVCAAAGAFAGCLLIHGVDGFASAGAVLTAAGAGWFLSSSQGRKLILPLASCACVLFTGLPFGRPIMPLLAESLLSGVICRIMLGGRGRPAELCRLICIGLGAALALEPFRLFGLLSPGACLCALGSLAVTRIYGREKGAACALAAGTVTDMALGFPCLLTSVIGAGVLGAGSFRSLPLTVAAFCGCAAIPGILWGDRGLFCLAQCLFAALVFLFIPDRLTRPPCRAVTLPGSGGAERLGMLSRAIEAIGESLSGEDEPQRLVKLQCRGLSAMLDPEESSPMDPVRERLAAIAAAYVPDSKLECSSDGGRLRIRLSPPPPDPDAFVRSASEALDCGFFREGDCFVQTERLSPKLYCAVRRRSGESACGDSLSHIRTRDGRAVVLLSDGMGAGDGAEMLSSGALRLIGGFVEAGADIHSAASAVLPSLTAAFETRGFVTLDLLEIGLYTGRASMVRMGAAPAWFLSGGKLKRIPGRGLPAGAEAGPPPPPIVLRPSPGDLLLMVTDGACEEPDAPASLIGRVPPEKLPEAVISRAAAAGSHDDITAVAVVF